VAQDPATIHVIADLECELDGKAVSVRSTGRKTIVDVPDVATGLNLIWLGSPRRCCRALRKIKRLLDSMSHVLELRVQGNTIGIIGHLEGNQFWRLLGLPALTLKPMAIVTETARRSKRR
jgi:hypothetical protein